MIRLLLVVGSYCLDVDLSRVADEEPDHEPVPQGSTSVTERAETWDHDNRSPIGFRRAT